MHKFANSVVNGITVKDPLSGNFTEVSNVTYSTFDIQVLTEAPSTNTTTHNFVSAVANSIERCVVRAGGIYTHAYVLQLLVL